jgi:hypothetical protein
LLDLPTLHRFAYVFCRGAVLGLAGPPRNGLHLPFLVRFIVYLVVHSASACGSFDSWLVSSFCRQSRRIYFALFHMSNICFRWFGSSCLIHLSSPTHGLPFLLCFFLCFSLLDYELCSITLHYNTNVIVSLVSALRVC